ncbi:hypothetical protein Droror1_Dr00002320 [Drosera rotundifolia]
MSIPHDSGGNGGVDSLSTNRKSKSSSSLYLYIHHRLRLNKWSSSSIIRFFTSWFFVILFLGGHEWEIRAAGFVGSHVSIALRKRGDGVREFGVWIATIWANWS